MGRRAAKTAALALLPAALIVTGWGNLERPTAGGELLLAAVLAVGVALIARNAVRWAAEAAAFLIVAAAAFDLSLLDAKPFDDARFFGPVISSFGGGVADFYEIALPFDPARRENMHGVLVVAVFAFCLLTALAIAARRPLFAAAVTFAGAAWPVTLVPEAASPARGALMLATALLLLAALTPAGRRGARQAAAVGTVVVAAALVAVSSPSVAKGGFLAWEQWEPYTRPEKPVSVQYVWDANYQGIRFPKNPTTVFRVEAPERVPYWRATTLDVFLDDHWRESQLPIEAIRVAGRDLLTTDPLLPAAARNPRTWIRQRVTIRALRDTRLVGASVPVAFEAGGAMGYGSGAAYVGALRRGYEYSAWSYAAQPTPARLMRSRPRYPSELLYGRAALGLGDGASMPPFGLARREGLVEQVFDDPDLAPYEPLYRIARRVVGTPRNPYAAVVALEAWFRTGGGFRYDERPPATSAYPLVAFVTDHRRGYCQHYAGAMALMLRMLGIPARVAAGFTTGTYDEDEGEWTVADTNAHTWVEVWFEGYGWLPFDPTPGRRLQASYTSSSLLFDGPGASAAFAGVAATALGFAALRPRLTDGDGAADGGPAAERGFGDTAAGEGAAGNASAEPSGPRLLGLALLLMTALFAALWLAKSLRRRVRYRTDDPRQIAAAVRRELADYLVDQRVVLPPSVTASELTARLSRSLRVDAEALGLALGTARFGPVEDAHIASRQARRELRKIIRALRKRLSTRARLRGVLSLRSLGIRSG